MSDHTKESSIESEHQSFGTRFDAIYSFAEKQSTELLPAPQDTHARQQQRQENAIQRPEEQAVPNRQAGKRTLLSFGRAKTRLPEETSPVLPSTDQTERLTDPKLLQERYHTMILPSKKALREHSLKMGLPLPQELQEREETELPFNPGHMIDQFPTLHMPIVQVKSVDFLRSETLFQQAGTLVDYSFRGKDTLDTIPMLVSNDIAKQPSESVPAMRSELTGAAGNAAIVGAGSLVGSVLKYGSNLIIQRSFGPAVYGLYSISYALVSLIAAIFNLGLDDAMVRYTAMYRTNKKLKSLGGLATFCTLTAGTAGVIGAVLVIIFAPDLAHFRHDVRLTPVLQFMAPLIPMLCMQIMWYSGLQGLKAFKWRVLAERIISPIVLVIALIAILFIQHNVIGVVFATLISIAVSMSFALYSFIRLLPAAAKKGPKQYELVEWLQFAIPNFLTSTVDMILESTDTLLLAFFSISNEQIGLYTAAIKLSGFIVMPQTSLNSMFAPTIAELHTKGEHEKLAIMFQVVTKWSITLSLPIFFTVTLFSRPILAISSRGFIEAWPILIAFAIGNIINTGTGSVGYLLMMTGHQKLSVFNSISAVIINVTVGIVLAPRYGAMGVAISTGLAIASINLLKLLQVGYFLKISPYNLGTLKPIAAGLVSAAITGGILYFLNDHHVNLYIQLLFIPVFLVSYGAFIFLFKVGAEDQIIIDALTKRLKRGKK